MTFEVNQNLSCWFEIHIVDTLVLLLVLHLHLIFNLGIMLEYCDTIPNRIYKHTWKKSTFPERPWVAATEVCSIINSNCHFVPCVMYLNPFTTIDPCTINISL